MVYFDNAATSQTPRQVVDAIINYYYQYNANIHRGVHSLSQEATDAYEAARKKLQKHFNAEKEFEIYFTAGTTHGINLVAQAFTELVKKGEKLLFQEWNTTATLFLCKCCVSEQAPFSELFR